MLVGKLCGVSGDSASVAKKPYSFVIFQGVGVLICIRACKDVPRVFFSVFILKVHLPLSRQAWTSIQTDEFEPFPRILAMKHTPFHTDSETE